MEKVNYKVDYVISHCCPTSIQTLINPTYKRDILTDYLQQISEKCTFKRRFVSIEKMVVQYNSIANKK